MAAARSDETKESLGNYLSQEYQLNYLEKEITIMGTILGIYLRSRKIDLEEQKENKWLLEDFSEEMQQLETKEVAKDPKEALRQRQLRREEFSVKLALAFYNEIMAAHTEFLHKLPTSRDKTALKSFFEKIEKISHLVKRTKNEKIDQPAEHSRFFGWATQLENICSNLITICKANLLDLEKAADLQIYEARVPGKWLEKNARAYFYKESRAEAAAKTTAGTLATVALVSNPIGWCMIAASEGKALVASGAAMTTLSKGWGCVTKKNIPGSYFKGQINFDNSDKDKPLMIFQANPKYEKNLESKENVTIYVVEGRDPGHLFQRGTDHAGSHQHVVFFDNVDDALRFIELRNSGEKYDTYGGFRMYNDWNDATREEARLAYHSPEVAAGKHKKR